VRAHELESLDGLEMVSLANQAAVFLVGRQAVRPLARGAIGLGQSVADGLGRRLELLGQRLWGATLTHQLDNPLSKLGWVRRSPLGIVDSFPIGELCPRNRSIPWLSWSHVEW